MCSGKLKRVERDFAIMRVAFKSIFGWIALLLLLIDLFVASLVNEYDAAIVLASLLLISIAIFKRVGLWSYLYVLSLISFLCLHEIIHSLGMFDGLSTLGLMGGRYSYTSESLHTGKKLLLLFLTGTGIGLSMTERFRKGRDSIKSTSKLVLLKTVFFLVLVINIVGKGKIYINSKTVGYVEAIHGATQTGLLFTVADIILPIVFSILLVNVYGDKKRITLYSIFFLLPYIILFLTGFRGELVGKIIAVLCLYSMTQKINKMWMLFGSVIGLVAVLSMEFLRFNSSISIWDLPVDAYVQAFMFAGNSFAVVPLTIENASELIHGWKYFFGGPLGVFSLAETYSLKGIIEKPYLPQHLTYIIDRNRFFGGSTIGGSVLAEVYMLSPKLVLVAGVLIPLLSAQVLRNSLRSGVFMYLSLTYMENLLFIARGGLLKFVDKEFVLGMITFALIFLLKQIISVRYE